MQSVHALFICHKENNVNFKCRQIRHIHILVSISHTDTFSTELFFGNLKLSIDISIRRREHIMHQKVVHSFSEGIKNLGRQFELLDLLNKVIIFPICLETFHIAVDHLNNLILNLPDCLTVQFGHRKKMCHPIQRF